MILKKLTHLDGRVDLSSIFETKICADHIDHIFDSQELALIYTKLSVFKCYSEKLNKEKALIGSEKIKN